VARVADVSVILIVKNGERFVGEALESIRSQTLAPREVLVIDGHSSDRTVEIARSYTGVVVVPQESTGVAHAYNEGIRLASCDLLAFISHDDRWMPTKLELQVESLVDRSDALVSLTDVLHVLDPDSSLPPGFRPELLDRPVPGYVMETMLARRVAFERVGYFDPDFAVSEDTDWFARALDAGIPMVRLPETLVYKRVHDANTSLGHSGINRLLLEALRRSIARKRARGIV